MGSAPVAVGVVALISQQEIADLMKNLGVLGKIIKTGIARAIASIGVDLLANAQPRVPIDTGELRESGRVILQFDRTYKMVGKGRADGSVMANLRGLKAYLPTNQIGVAVQYTRFNEDDMDIAFWCHEELRPQEERVNRVEGEKYAVTVGTGPKYLELPFAEKRDEYIRFIENLFSNRNLGNVIEKASQIIEGTRTKYGVNRVKLVLDRIEQFGYFG